MTTSMSAIHSFSVEVCPRGAGTLEITDSATPFPAESRGSGKTLRFHVYWLVASALEPVLGMSAAHEKSVCQVHVTQSRLDYSTNRNRAMRGKDLVSRTIFSTRLNDPLVGGHVG